MTTFSYDEAAEKCLLGALLLGDQSAVEQATSVVSSHDFYIEHHSTVFEAISRLAIRGESVDILTVQAELIGQSVFEQIGGMGFVIGLFEDTPTADHVTEYAETIRLCALWRGH